MNRAHFAPVFSVIAMLLTIAFAAGLDQIINFLREQNSRTLFTPSLLLWCYTLGNLLMAGLLVSLFTWVLFRLPRNTWVAAFYLLMGLYISSSFQVLYFLPVGRFIQNLLVLPTSFTFMAGGMITFTGLVILFNPIKHKYSNNQIPQE